MSRSQPERKDTLPDLLPDWYRTLRIANRSPRTIQSYALAADQFVTWLKTENRSLFPDEIRRADIEEFLLSGGEQITGNSWSDATRKQRYASLRQLWRWFKEVPEAITENPFDKIRPPRIASEKPVPVLDLAEIESLLRACSGKRFDDVRDAAIIRTLFATGIRLGELVGLTLDDLDLNTDEILVLGKGRKYRSLPLSPKTALAVSQYLRRRRTHTYRDTPNLWLGSRGPLKASGVHQLLRRRSRQAGIDPVHAHQFRHTFASLWLERDHQEGDLMNLAGWSSDQMIRRYGATQAQERAKNALRRDALGDLI